jgi:uncharacterized RDD family membrane protein YckC
VTSPENPARWAPDPLGRHHYRYWDGAQWTEHVSDDGVVSVDPPVANPTPATDPPSTPSAPAEQPAEDVPPEAAGYAAPTPTPTSEPTPTPAPTPTPTPWSEAPPGGFGGTHLGAPLPGSGAASAVAGATAGWPQQPAAYDATAVLGRRYGAFLIDAAISLIVFGVLFFATATTHSRAEMLQMPGCHLSANDSAQVECDNRAVVTVNDTVYEAEGGPYVLGCIAFTLLYFALMEGLAGATLGKLMTGLRVVTPEGGKCGLGRALVRWLVFAVDGPLTLFICGIVTSSVSAGHRRLGDMAAGTYVIGKADVGRAVSPRPR